MALKILSAKDYSQKLKASLHATGKIGFTEATAIALELTKESRVTFAKDDEDDTLYLINKVEDTPDAFRVLKAGVYFSVNAKSLFDALGYDYKKKNIMFDLIKDNNYPDQEVYRLNKREVPRKQKKE